MKRVQKEYILKDLEKKIVLLVGPRQAGKTWLAKEVAQEFTSNAYLNYDQTSDREIAEGGRTVTIGHRRAAPAERTAS